MEWSVIRLGKLHCAVEVHACPIHRQILTNYTVLRSNGGSEKACLTLRRSLEQPVGLGPTGFLTELLLVTYA